MRKHFAAVALTAALAQPASATTFPSLTTIYIGSGVFDDGAAANAGIATSIQCSNVSGVPAQMRVVFLNAGGAVEGTPITFNLSHGAQLPTSTHQTVFIENSATTGAMQGTVNVESTQSGVFCTGTSSTPRRRTSASRSTSFA